MGCKLYKFSGAGNDFIVLDGRDADLSAFRSAGRIAALCREYSTDGLMILGRGSASSSDTVPRVHAGKEDNGLVRAGEGPASFSMEYYNPDGSWGMMCGNGGRCMAAFADYLGIPAEEKSEGPKKYVFSAPDGLHDAEILDRKGGNWTVKLHMSDVRGISPVAGGFFINTGTRHLVLFVPDVEKVDVEKEGKVLRNREEFAPEGTNVNFVEIRKDGSLKVRTFEKGVERETLACGTGITASALVAFAAGSDNTGAPVHVTVHARRDTLSVDFIPSGPDSFEKIYLTGPAELLDCINI